MELYTTLSDYDIYRLFKKTKTRKKRISEKCVVEYLNTVATFDTETTSYYVENEKKAYCYIWQMCINGVCVFGRTLDEFKTFTDKISRVLRLTDKRRLCIYVHNLDFDFQFIRKYFTWAGVFARVERKPIYALTENGLEFRCSYLLTMLPLSKLPAQIPNYHGEKMIGDLDYSLPRHSETPLTEKELYYCEQDVKILYDYMQYEMNNNGNNVTKIPLTKTGYVRRECKQALHKNRDFWKKYQKKLTDAFPTPELFTLLFKAYQGGYTHANSKYAGLALENVESIDFASSYPSVMVCERFPWRFHKIEITSKKMLERFLSGYACVFEVCFENIHAKTTTSTISTSKCEFLANPKTDNGRLISADICRTYATDLDYKTIQMYYTYDHITIGIFYYARYESLPTPLIDVILQAYTAKTELKGVKGKEAEYQVAKGIINGVYGMCVTNPVAEEISYTDEWSKQAPCIEEALETSKEKAFLLYQWGVWVSAHARFKLLSTVRQIEKSVVYCDTDSIKYIKNADAVRVVTEYNEKQTARFEQIARDHSYVIPTTAGGERAIMGVFDYEGRYDLFKTLGAKRYVYEKNGEFGVTIAGLPKKAGKDYIEKHGGFTFFTDGMEIPPESSGKKEHTYLDDESTFFMTDYNGSTKMCYSPSAVHLSPTGFSMGLASEYIALITQKQCSALGVELGKETLPEFAIGATRFLKEARGDYNEIKIL